MDVRFVIRSPSGKRRNGVVPLPVLVGRGEEAKIRIPQDAVSRRHCQFVERDGHVYIRDLGSTNGTLLDGKRVQPDVDTPVSSGGTVSVGDVQIRIEYAAPRAADDDRTILLKRLPDADVAEAADAEHPGFIELGAASDETQSDAGQPFEIEPQAAEPIAPVAVAEPPAPMAAGAEPTERAVEPAEAGAEDFAFLSAENPGASPDEPSTAATAGSGRDDREVETAEPNAGDFAFLSAADAGAPPAVPAKPAPPAQTPPAAAKPAAKPTAKPAVKPAAKPAGKPSAAAPAAQSPAKTPAPAKPAAKPDPQVPAVPPGAAEGDDFGFLAAAPASTDEAPAEWPIGAEEPAPVDEDDLNDFFKSLS
jgi:hypothetical protein